jgi:protein-tyrosine phosphatase
MAREAGVRTIIGQQLTTLAGSAQFPAPAAAQPSAWATRVEVALDDIADTRFWQFLNRERLNGTPLYFRPFLDRKAERCAAAVTALAAASSGGVIFHCGAGRDRTGLVTLLLLALVGVEPDAIARDYEQSTEHLKALFTAMGQQDQGPSIEAALAERGTTAREAILATLDGFDAENYLLTAGVSPASLATVRHRLLG